MLKQNREFQQVYKKGKSAHARALVLFYLPDPHAKAVGFTASKKVGNAVTRNRAKRRMRALFQRFESELRCGSYVLVAKAATADVPFDALLADMRSVLQKCKAFA